MIEGKQARREIIREQAEAEEYAPMGEKAKRKANWEDLEAELQEILNP